MGVRHAIIILAAIALILISGCAAKTCKVKTQEPIVSLPREFDTDTLKAESFFFNKFGPMMHGTTPPAATTQTTTTVIS